MTSVGGKKRHCERGQGAGNCTWALTLRTTRTFTELLNPLEDVPVGLSYRRLRFVRVLLTRSHGSPISRPRRHSEEIRYIVYYVQMSCRQLMSSNNPDFLYRQGGSNVERSLSNFCRYLEVVELQGDVQTCIRTPKKSWLAS